MTPTLPGRGTLLARGLRKRCPICGRGKLFRRWFVLPERCPNCGFRFEQREGAFLGSMAINYGVAGVAFMIFLAIYIPVNLPGVEVARLMVASMVLVTAVLILVFPFSKTIWAAIDVMLLDPQDLDLG